MAPFAGIRSFVVPTPVVLADCRKRQLNRRGRRPITLILIGAALCHLSTLFPVPVCAQDATTYSSATASDAGLNLVRWAGNAPEAAGQTVEISFALYENAAGGLALWRETQSVKVGPDGRYTALLGATSAEGISQAFLRPGEARWIEALVIAPPDVAPAAGSASAPPLRRNPLAVVPYAFKSVDAQTLDGRAAEDYVTREDLQSVVDQAVAGVKFQGTPGSTAFSAGSGGAGYIPLWIGNSALGSSAITQFGRNVGIGTSNPDTLLDVNGATTLRAAVSLLASAATVGAGVNSPTLQLSANTYSSADNGAVPQTFAWQAQSADNNTAHPAARLALLFGSGNKAPNATGLSIAPNGQITFAPGQSFPGMSNDSGAASSAITGVKVGPGLVGGGSGGEVSISLSLPISTANGGTGATTPAGALESLGAVPAEQVGALTQADKQPGVDFGQKVNNCLAAAIALGTNVCDARNLTGAQSLTADLVFTADNASHMTLLLAANVTVNQGTHQVIIEPGVSNFSVVGSGAWSSQGPNGRASGATFQYSGSDYAWKVAGGVLNTWTFYIRLQDFAISVSTPGTASGLYLGPEVEDVYLERMRIALPTRGATGYALHMYGGASGSGMYSSFAHIDAPEFVGGAGVLVDGNGLAMWGQSKVIGGRIMASGPSVPGSYCVNQVDGELSMVDTDLENCDVGLHIMNSNTVHPYVHPDGCCVNIGVQLDGPGARNNYIVTTSTHNSQINGAGSNTVFAAGGSTVFNDLGAGGSTISNYLNADAPVNQLIASGKSVPQSANLYFGDGSKGSLVSYWSISKDTANGFEIGDLASRTNRLQFSPGANGNTSLSANGSGVVSFNWSSGTGGVVFGDGSGENTASIGSSGLGTFKGVTDTEVTGMTQCAQFSSGGVLGGTGSPCATAPAAETSNPVRWTFVGISPGAAVGGPWGRYTPDVDVTIISEEYTFYRGPAGCSVYPTVKLADNGTAIPGSVQRLASNAGGYTGLALSVAAGHVISVLTDPGSGCTGQNNGVYTITLKAKGSR